MLVSSKDFPESTLPSKRHTLVLRHETRSVLVLLPRTYRELLTLTRSIFALVHSPNFVFETRDLDICHGDAVEIHPAAWEAVAMSLSTLSVRCQSQDLGSSSSQSRGPQDNASPQHPHATHGTNPHSARRAPDAPSGSSNEATQSENDLSAPATSYDDVQDSIPTDFAEEDLGSYEDDFEDTPAAPKGKGKGKASARTRIESDAEDEYDDDRRAEDAGVARGLGWLVPSPVQNTATKTDPSFSILPLSPSKRVALPSISPQRVSVHSPTLFLPRVKLGVNSSSAQSALSDEELRKLMQVVSDTSLRSEGTSKETAAPTSALASAALKDASHEYPPQPKFNPQVKVPAAFTAAPTSAPALSQTPGKASSQTFDKILITIRHPPTDRENKFKVKSTHLVGRVLTSACSAFELSPTGATLMAWSDEDGLEITSPCANDVPMGSVATDGAIFIIELPK
ncbi:hypothetical protein EI94DRAFT_1832659 [Lactarius quietus]|nr:hypothetical protein EI94DRAFT_1832659 [Lactarius quietus]